MLSRACKGQAKLARADETSWNITPLCGSTTLKHVEEALELESSSLGAESQGVAELKSVMLGA
jgi:hypothetical protein